MNRPILPAAIALSALLGLATLPPAAQAQSSLGIAGAELTFGLGDDETGIFRGVVDVAITAQHGLQGTLEYDDYGPGEVGRIAGLLYLAPEDGQRYGVDAMFADVNDRSFSYGQIGAAGMFALGRRTDLELRAAIGFASQGGLDWLTAGVGVAHGIAPGAEIYASYDIAEFEETGFDALGHETVLGLRWRPEGRRWSVFAEVAQDRLTGRDGAAPVTTLRAGLSVAFGATGGDRRAFRVSDPARQLLRRGLY